MTKACRETWVFRGFADSAMACWTLPDINGGAGKAAYCGALTRAQVA